MEKIQKLCVVLMILLVGAVIYKPISTRLNENAAIATLKTIKTAQANYRAAKGQYATLDDLIKDGLLPSNLSDGKRSGYKFGVTASGDKFYVTAVPERYGANNYFATGRISLFMDESNIIKVGYKSGEEATSADPPLAAKYQ